jgi:hypothetical protein
VAKFVPAAVNPVAAKPQIEVVESDELPEPITREGMVILENP